jgi:flagellar hook-associated protein 2
MAIQFGGLASGLDVNAIIDGLMKVERVPLDRLLARKASVDKAKDAVSDLSKKLAALRAAADTLATPSSYASFAVTSADATTVAATVSGAAAPGVYGIRVNALAKEERTQSNTWTSSTSALNTSGTLGITVGSNPQVDVAINNADSLATIASKINASGARVSASVVYDGTSYRLLVRGLDTGAANAITFVEAGGLNLGLALAANQIQAAENASFVMDGITITRPTNQVSDLIPGVTLALGKVSSATVNVTVASDPEALKKKIESFVTAYNDVVKAAHDAAGFGSQKAVTPELSGDPSIRSALSRLAEIMYTPVTGTTGPYTTLASVGLAQKSDGTIAIDGAKLSSALAANATAVAKLFTVDSTLGATGAMGAFKSAIDLISTDAGSLLKSRIDGLASLSQRLQKDADALELRASRYESRLRQQFTALEKRMSAYQSQLAAVSTPSTSTSSYTR